uniref:Phlebovirus glycoprotein G2 fusion domain-containing protein n=1 Tax=Meloidogyne enterolobii TaxID=390850 RepID=A0A6V7WGK7_MELEN|nr:unnamed protein product [Meloidogyne enterolobii]
MKVAVLIFLSLAQNTKSLTTITAEQEKCIINKMGYRNCLFENVLVMNFNPNEQEIDILLQDYQSNSVGSMKFLMNRIKAKCVKEVKYYSRSYDIQIISGWRCPYTGSCTEMKCSSLKMNETIEELETDKNNYPKITRCMETEGGWANGCFYVIPACLFYKYSAIPTNEPKVLEIFKCPKWDLELDIKIIIETQNETITNLVSLRPGRTSEWNDLRLTATSMTVALKEE